MGKISVIMVTHNREAFVGNMIEDILAQTYTDFEYIIVDNHSVDQSGKLIEEYAKKDNRIKAVVLEKESHVGEARNKGLAIAQGEFITFVDDDDRVEKDFLEFLMKLIRSKNVDFVMCGATEKRGEKIEPQCMFEGEYELNAQEAIVELLKREHIRAGMPTKLFRREILQMYPFKEDCNHEDIYTIYKYLSEIRKGIICGSPKYCFIRHGNNLSYFTTDFSVTRPEQLEEYLQAFRERTRFISAKFPNIAELAQYSEWSYMISMCYKIIEYKLDSCKTQLYRMKEELNSNKEMFCASMYIKDFEKEWMEKYIDGKQK